MIEGAFILAKQAIPWVHGTLKNTSYHGGIGAPIEVVNEYCKEEPGGLLIVHRNLDRKTGN